MKTQFIYFIVQQTEKPVLGKISLIRRAKSAVDRTSSSAASKRNHDRHPLFHIAWDEKELQPAGGGGFQNDGFVFDEAIVAADGTLIGAATEVATNVNDDDTPMTVDEVKRHMEQFHMRKCTPPHGTRVMDERTGKFVKTRRTKTARNKYFIELLICLCNTFV